MEITLRKTNVNDVEQLLLMATSVEATYVQDNKYGNPAELYIESFAYGCLNLSYYPY